MNVTAYPFRDSHGIVATGSTSLIAGRAADKDGRLVASILPVLAQPVRPGLWDGGFGDVTADYVPTDPLYSDQWHFGLIGDIETIWEEYTGAGVHVGLYDDGFQYDHPDLDDNYDPSLHFTNGDGVVYDPYPNGPDDGHGTSVAGLIGAEWGNGLGGVGVAPEVSLTGINFIVDIQNEWIDSGDPAIVFEALHWAANFDIMSNSWGFSPAYDPDQNLADPDSLISQWVNEYAYISAEGRDGLGTVIIQAAGNDSTNANADGLNGSRYTATIAATDTAGTVQYYSNWGSGILVAAPAASVTTDLTGSGGYSSGDYTDGFGGTSAATPVVSGVVALMLEANPELGWRDVHNILAISAAQTGSAYGSSGIYPEFSTWGPNDATNWNGGAMSISLSYGYGMVDAYAAVRMAESWFEFFDGPRTSANEQHVTASYDGGAVAIPDLGVGEVTLDVTESIEIETVMVTVDITHSAGGDLVLWLISPGGEEIPFMVNEGQFVFIPQPPYIDDTLMDDGFVWSFEVSLMRGSDSAGQWTLRAEDTYSADSGVINDFTLDFYGAPASADTVYHFTDDFLELAAVESGRSSIVDSDGGTDWMNLVALTGAVNIDLGASGGLTVDGVVWADMGAGTLIENAATGDGDDTLTGNDVGNELQGGRGSDFIYGLAGADTLVGGAGDDTVDGGAGNDLLYDGAGNDFYSGGADADTLYMLGNLADFEITFVEGLLELLQGGITDIIDDTVETIVFDDQTRSFADLAGSTDPDLPLVAIVSATDDAGDITGDLPAGSVTDDTAPVLNGTLSAPLAEGQVVAIYRDDQRIGEALVSSTDWTFADANLAEGAHLYSARVEDAGSATSGPPATGFPLTIDITGPTVSITLDDTELTTGETATVAFAFSEEVTGLYLSDITASGGTLSGLASTDGGLSWTALFTPDDGIDISDATIALTGAYTDAAGNAGAPGESAPFSINTLASGENMIFGTDGSDTLIGTADADVISGVPEDGGALGVGTIDVLTGAGGADRFVIGNTTAAYYDDGNRRSDGKGDYARITDFATGDQIEVYGGLDYVITPYRMSGVDGWAIIIDEDRDGNADRKEEIIAHVQGTAPTLADLVDATGGTPDTTPPEVNAITLDDTSLTTGETATVTFSFSEAVTGFDLSDVTANLGTLANLQSIDGGATWTAVFTPTDNVQSTTATIAVTGAYQDLAGNPGTGGTSDPFSIDTTGSEPQPAMPTDGDDVITGTSGDDILTGVPTGSTLNGTGTVDTLAGLGGADVFVFGAGSVVYYDNGNDRNDGKSDYALVLDFSVEEGDKIELAGDETEYALQSRKIGGVDGTAIIWDSDGDGIDNHDEVIGLLAGVQLSDLSAIAVFQGDALFV
jgi:subtilisin family serine protease/subtilisin-like proprotein convertase family protein